MMRCRRRLNRPQGRGAAYPVSTLRKAITSRRSSASGMPAKLIFVPFRKVRGFSSQSSSRGPSQTKSACFAAVD